MNHHYYTSQLFALSKLDFTMISREERERKDREKDRWIDVSIFFTYFKYYTYSVIILHFLNTCAKMGVNL